jgi:hypothetical protein
MTIKQFRLFSICLFALGCVLLAVYATQLYGEWGFMYVVSALIGMALVDIFMYFAVKRSAPKAPGLEALADDHKTKGV